MQTLGLVVALRAADFLSWGPSQAYLLSWLMGSSAHLDKMIQAKNGACRVAWGRGEHTVLSSPSCGLDPAAGSRSSSPGQGGRGRGEAYQLLGRWGAGGLRDSKLPPLGKAHGIKSR